MKRILIFTLSLFLLFQYYPPSRKTMGVSPWMEAKSFSLRRDFAPDAAGGEDTRSVSSRELHFVASAKEVNSRGNSGNAAQGKSNNANVENKEAKLSSDEAKLKSAPGKIKLIEETTADPEIGAEAVEISQNQEEVEKSAEEAIEKVDDRPAFVKFLIGPDLKNLGQLRSEVVKTRNNIRQLEKLQERAGETEQPAIKAAILELEETAYKLQAEMYSKLSGFSLFGWLIKWMDGFKPEDEVSVTPTITVVLTISGVLTVTPGVTQEVTATPVPPVTSEPTETSTPTPAI